MSKGRKLRRYPWEVQKIKQKLKRAGEDSLVTQWIRICLPVRGHRCDPWSRETSHVTGEVSPRATATKARALEPVLLAERPLQGARARPRTAAPARGNWKTAVQDRHSTVQRKSSFKTRAGATAQFPSRVSAERVWGGKRSGI